MKRHVNIAAVEYAKRFLIKHRVTPLPPLTLLGSAFSAATTILALDLRWGAALVFAMPAIAVIGILIRMTSSSTRLRLSVIGRLVCIYALYLAIEIVRALIDATWSDKTTAITVLAFFGLALGGALNRGLPGD